MNTKAILLIAILFIPSIVSGKEPAKPISADTIQVLKIAAQDERAVIKTPDGKTQIIKPGDSLGTSGKVVEIAADRVVLEEKSGAEAETVIIRLKDGKQSVERLKKIDQKRPVLYAPAVKEMNK